MLSSTLCSEKICTNENQGKHPLCNFDKAWDVLNVLKWWIWKQQKACAFDGEQPNV
jgi:hypothetical protein